MAFMSSKALGLAAALTSSLLALPVAGASTRPNIVFILADDLGYGDVGAYGQEKIKTPNLDRMAAEGVRFTDAYAGAPICTPSRLSLLTGRHVGNLRVNTNVGPAGYLRQGDVTLGTLFKQAGYATAMIGKWAVGVTAGESLPSDHGFDHWLGYPDNMTAHDYFPANLWRNGERLDLPRNIGGMQGTYSNDLFTDEAIRFIAQSKGKPFFLYLAYTIPHAALEVPQDSLKEYAGKFPEEIWRGAAGEDPSAPYYPTPVLQPNATRAAMIARLDGYIGQVLDALATQGLEEDTVVFFTSDNGPEAVSGADLDLFKASGPFQGQKFDLHEGGIREPLIVRWPGTIAAGRVEPTPVAFWDFMTTFRDLAQGADLPSDGVSLAPLLLGTAQERGPRDLYWEFGGRDANGKPKIQQAIRRGDLKGLRLSQDGPVMVFDLSTDLAEEHDLSAQHPALAQEFKAIMDGYLAARGRSSIE